MKFLWVVLLITLSALGEGNTTPNQACNPNDLKGLSNFKAGIPIDTSGRLAMWVGGGCCEWQGITCDNRTGRVIGISLPAWITKDDEPFLARMVGTLSPSINLISFLEVLNLGENSDLTGNIPELILPKLQRLYLYSNSFYGPVPDSIASLTHLVSLDLRNNSLSGHIPQGIGQLQVLQDLDFSNNFLSGKLPSSMANLSAIRNLGLDSNFLEGPITFLSISPKMSHLRLIRLQDNSLTGKIPKFIGQLPQLEHLLLSRNMIEGPLPSEMSSLKHLETLDVSFNPLRLSAIPKWLPELPSLLRIFLAGCEIQGEIPELFPSAIKELDLSANNLTGSIPTRFGDENFQMLFSLNLSKNALVSNIPESIGNLKRLIWLDLHANKLSSNLPEALGNLIKLTKLELQQNQFSGTIPNKFLKLKDLWKFDVSDNLLEGKIPEGKPFSDFPKSSYSGNKGLCGKPLPPCKKT